VGAEPLLKKILMRALRFKLLVVEPDEAARIKICTWLSQEGYSVFECRDAYKALRLTRQVLPDIVLLNSSITGINSKQLIGIIESEKLSRVLLLTSQENDEFTQMLRLTQLKTWIKKPVNRKLFIENLKETLISLQDTRRLQSQQARLEQNSEDEQVIYEAKGILMVKWNLSEEEAYAYIRNKSMQHCVSKVSVARHVIMKNGAKKRLE
jgi:AmiR/NasT family two-component response regulator